MSPASSISAAVPGFVSSLRLAYPGWSFAKASVAVAWAAIPSPRPVNPSFSDVVAFTATRLVSMPARPAMRCRMASRCARPAGQAGRTESQGRRTRDGRGQSIRLRSRDRCGKTAHRHQPVVTMPDDRKNEWGSAGGRGRWGCGYRPWGRSAGILVLARNLYGPDAALHNGA